MKLPFRTLRSVRRRASRLILLVGLILRVAAATARPDPNGARDLDGATLMRLALEHDEAERRRRADWICDEEVVTVRTDAQDHALDTRRESRPGVPLDQPQGASGSLPSGADATVDHPSGEHENAGRFDVTVDLGRLVDRFDLRREADGISRDGRACYVVAFRPRASAAPAAGSREERVVSQLAGRFWLARDDLAIVQSEGELVQAVPMVWVASVDHLRFRYQSLSLPGAGGTVPASFELELSVSAPFYHSHQRQTTTMTHHRPHSPR